MELKGAGRQLTRSKRFHLRPLLVTPNDLQNCAWSVTAHLSKRVDDVGNTLLAGQSRCVQEPRLFRLYG